MTYLAKSCYYSFESTRRHEVIKEIIGSGRDQ